MTTLYANHIYGVLSATVNSTNTTLSSAAFAELPTVSGDDILWLVLDPTSTAGAPEVVKVTAHTTASTSVTVTRGQQGSTARSHLISTTVSQPVTKSDLESFLTAVPDDGVSTSSIVDDAVTTAKIADDAVTTAKIPDDAVTIAKFDGSIFPLWTGWYTGTATDVDDEVDITFSTGQGGTNPGWSTGTHDTVTPTVAGWYLVTTSVTFPGASSGKVRDLRINATTAPTDSGKSIIAASMREENEDNEKITLAVSGHVYCNGTTDTVKIEVKTGDGGRSFSFASVALVSPD